MGESGTLERWIAFLNNRDYARILTEMDGAQDVLSQSLVANLVQATALEALGQTEPAGQAFERAVALEPGNPVAQNNRAGFLERQGRLDEALRGYEAALEAAPGLAAVHVNRGRMLMRLDRHENALAAFDQAIALQPGLADAHLERGVALERLGREPEAERAYRAALQDQPQQTGVRLNLVKLLFRAKRLDECLREADQGLAQAPRSASLHYWRGAALRVAERLREAIEAMDRCLALDPAHVAAWCDKGQMLEALHRTGEALAAFEAALAVAPNTVSALNGVAATSWTLGRQEFALATIDGALQHAPNSANSLLVRAAFFQRMGKSHEAIADAQQAAALAPQDVRAWHLLAELMSERGNHADALTYLARAEAIAPHGPAVESSLLWNMLHVPEVTRDEVVARHLAWGRRFGSPEGMPKAAFANPRDPDRQLRVGFVSPDLVNHPVGRLLNGVLPHLERTQLHVTCYNNNPETDELTATIRSGADGWQDVWARDDSELADLIRGDAIDILVDLAGHTKGNRLRCFARRPAPVQATLWGYPFTTGLSAMDFAIMDEAAVPQGMESLFIERVIRLPGGRFRLPRPQVALPLSMPPVVRRGYVTFGCFNNIAKLNAHVYDTWATLLRRVPKSRLLLKWFNLDDPEVAGAIRDALVTRGIAGDRLELRGGSTYEKMLAEYNDVDIALDPFPFSGGITSFDALWMGVPIVTLPTWQPVSRQTLGYLMAIGRESLAAKNEADYVAIAVRLAGDPSLLTAWRFSQRFAVENSSIGDFAGAARELREAFRFMWRDYLARTTNPA